MNKVTSGTVLAVVLSPLLSRFVSSDDVSAVQQLPAVARCSLMTAGITPRHTGRLPMDRWTI